MHALCELLPVFVFFHRLNYAIQSDFNHPNTPSATAELTFIFFLWKILLLRYNNQLKLILLGPRSRILAMPGSTYWCLNPSYFLNPGAYYPSYTPRRYPTPWWSHGEHPVPLIPIPTAIAIPITIAIAIIELGTITDPITINVTIVTNITKTITIIPYPSIFLHPVQPTTNPTYLAFPRTMHFVLM